MKVQCFAKQMRAGAIVGTVTALVLLIGAHTGAQVAQVDSLVSVCVNQSTGAMRMLLKASLVPANCSAGEQFIQLVQTLPGTQQAGGPRALNGSNSDHGLRELARHHGEAGITGGGTPGDYALRRVAYYESQGSGADSGSGTGNQPQGTGGNSGASAQGDQSGAFTSSGKLVPSEQGDQSGAFTSSGKLVPGKGKPVERVGYEQTNFPGQVDIVYAPFEVRDRTTKKVLAQIISNGGGGRLQMLDADGSVVATIGTASQGTGAVAVYNKEVGLVGLGFTGGAVAGEVSILTPSYKKIAQLAGGNKGQMGLRIFNPSGAEVVTLEDLPGGSGGGGLMIHNATGGSTATIATGKNGAGIFHGILAGPAIGAAW
jgi:hypothetical protein